MKLTWDNIDDYRLTKRDNFKHITKTSTFVLKEKCSTCNTPFMAYKETSLGLYCSHQCREPTKEHQEKLKKYQSNFKGKNHPNWKGGGVTVPYTTFHERLDIQEETRCVDIDILEVQCFKCHKWMKPTRNQTNNRILGIGGKHRTYNYFYCSDKCKKECSVFRKRPDTIIKRIEIENGTRPNDIRNKEFQSTFAYLLIRQRGKKCELCCSINNISAHHITPVSMCEDIFTWDLDNGILLCRKCHGRSHQGYCSTTNLRRINYDNKE